MTAADILEQLRPLGRDSYKRVMTRNHGVPEPIFGVPISELKKFQKRIRRDYQLALDLFETGNYDAMYLAGLIADDARMTREDLQHWVSRASSRSLAGSTIPWVAAGSPHGWSLALEWIDAPAPFTATAGWATLASIVSVVPDSQLDLPTLDRLVNRAATNLHAAPDVVRHQMHAFLLCVGCCVVSRTERLLELADRLGPVTADLGANSCEIPDLRAYVEKVRDRGTLGRKRKTAKC